MSSLINFINENTIQCLFVKYIGIECLGCGFQRSIILLLKGEIISSIRMYPSLIPIIGFLVLVLIDSKYSLKSRSLGLFFLSALGIFTTLFSYFGIFTL